MLHKCANPVCSTEFRRLRDGKLFHFQPKPLGKARQQKTRLTGKTRAVRSVERYWLCDDCSAYVTLTFDQERGMITVPLPGTGSKNTARAVTSV